MDNEVLTKDLLNNLSTASGVVDSLHPQELDDLILHLKEQVDTHWWSNAKQSLQLADLIIALGKTSGNRNHYALGLMARGDSLRFLGQLTESWEVLTEAADTFEAAGNQVGWARTWIGRLLLCLDLHKVDETLAAVERSEAILLEAQEIDKLLRLKTNLGTVYDIQGNYLRCLEILKDAIELAESVGDAALPRLRHLYLNIGATYTNLTQFDKAKYYYERARDVYFALNDDMGIALADLNLGELAELQGHYRIALDHYHRVQDIFDANRPLKWGTASRYIVRCYMELNRLTQAYHLAIETVKHYQKYEAKNYLAQTLDVLAQTQIRLSLYPDALNTLQGAEQLFLVQDAQENIKLINLRRAQIHYLSGNYTAAEPIARSSVSAFKSTSVFHYASALLLLAQIQFKRGNSLEVTKLAYDVLSIARNYSLSLIRFRVYMLLGRLNYDEGRRHQALRLFQAADATVNRVQKRLTLSLRSDFMKDKDGAFHNLMYIYLDACQINQALDTLERHKSQVFWHYLTRQDTLRWTFDNTESINLHHELEQLRGEHHFYYRKLRDINAQTIAPNTLLTKQLQHEIINREKQMRRITERLYLHSKTNLNVELSRPLPTVEAINAAIPKDATLVEYYSDGHSLWAFIYDGETLRCQKLPETMTRVTKLIQQLQFNIDSALMVGINSKLNKQLKTVADRILQRLTENLLAPLLDSSNELNRIYIVPYGPLHYLPFHLLQVDKSYLVESCEIVILPTSSLLIRDPIPAAQEALVVGHSQNGVLSAVREEAQFIYDLLGGALYLEAEAQRDVLTEAPRSVLHIAAHGEFRLDQPDLSFIELDEGQLYTDDLLQRNLSYQLVTLSACETGRVQVAPGDELIGLGRGFLYAGAEAIVTSLWRTDDQSTLQLMKQFYKHLVRGTSKAHALQMAQKQLLEDDTDMHPAFWGAFQLMGNPGSLRR